MVLLWYSKVFGKQSQVPPDVKFLKELHDKHWLFNEPEHVLHPLEQAIGIKLLI